MTSTIWLPFGCLLLAILLIVLLTVKWKMHAFFALIAAALLVGIGTGTPVLDVLSEIRDGFGNILKSLGLIIVLGTTLGVLLEKSGSTKVMAAFILKQLGDKHAAMAMSITGFVVGLPIFCDSGYIVLSGLNNSIAAKTRMPMPVMATSLATGLLSIHCLIPPHPGAAAAAGLLNVEFGRLMIMGITVAIPAAIAGHQWARFAGKKFTYTSDQQSDVPGEGHMPKVLAAFLPVVIPILLIALRSFAIGPKDDQFTVVFRLLTVLGEPAVALSVGIMIVLLMGRPWVRLPAMFSDAAEKAGGILVIIGAGGAFGAVLAATKPGAHLSAILPLAYMGIWFPFLVTTILKTAQGSSTVAIMTAAALVQPLLPALGLNSDTGRLLCLLSMGAGSMMISHANDAYFWVIARFSRLDMRAMLRVYTMATVCMGLASILIVYLLSKIL